MNTGSAARVREILAAVKPLAVEYYALTGKPLGVTGEVAEYIAAETLGLVLAGAREDGYDAIRQTPHGPERIQIKGRAYSRNAPEAGQRISRISDKPNCCEAIVLVILDNETLEPREMWEAPFPAVAKRLAVPGSKARDRGALGVSEFKRIDGARQVWSELPTPPNLHHRPAA